MDICELLLYMRARSSDRRIQRGTGRDGVSFDRNSHRQSWGRWCPTGEYGTLGGGVYRYTTLLSTIGCICRWCLGVPFPRNV